MSPESDEGTVKKRPDLIFQHISATILDDVRKYRAQLAKGSAMLILLSLFGLGLRIAQLGASA